MLAVVGDIPIRTFIQVQCMFGHHVEHREGSATVCLLVVVAALFVAMAGLLLVVWVKGLFCVSPSIGQRTYGSVYVQGSRAQQQQ